MEARRPGAEGQLPLPDRASHCELMSGPARSFQETGAEGKGTRMANWGNDFREGERRKDE
jgi:hypothetical protein